MGAAEDDARDVNVNKPLLQISKLFLTWFSQLGETKAGRLEACGMLGICLLRAVELKLSVEAVRFMDGTLNSRSVGDFKVGLARILAINFGGSLLQLLYSYLQARLTWKWQHRLTDHVHSLYFRNKAYYFIGEGGGVGGDKLTDPDQRIVGDIAMTAQTFSDCFSDALFAGTAGVFYTANVLRLFGWKYALAPYAYLGAAFVVVDVVAPVRKTWRRLEKQRWSAMSAYSDAQERLMLQSEAVVSLQGSDRERDVISQRYDVFKARTSVLFVAYLKFGTVNQFIINYLLTQFTSILVIAPGIWNPKFKGGVTTIEQMAAVRADAGVQFVLFHATMDAARVVVEMIRKLQLLVGQVERVTELLDLLDKVEKNKVASNESIEPGSSIKFSDVTIRTPAGVKLVEHLSFELAPGGSLLLTGHNGAGKSSIFRCLGGLWAIPHGKITKPGGSTASMNSTIFYLPQKPYNVIGTLPEQMTYPDVTASKELGAEQLTKILKSVDLSYLMEREDVMTKETNWEEELSLGEKQRLAIARLVHHRPKFAVLDECTSAVSSEMERRLYQICLENEITFVTISHRPALQAYHDQMLAIGDGKCGYTLTDIDRTAHTKTTLAMARASVISKDTEQSIARHAEARSLPYADMRNKAPLPPGPGTLKRLVRIWGFGKPSYAYVRAALHLSLMAAQTLLEDYLMGNTGSMFGCLMRADKMGFATLVRRGVIAAVGQAVLAETFLWVQREAVLSFQSAVSRAILPRYLANGNFYKIYSLDGRIKDAAHRVVHDVKNVGFALEHLYSGGVLSFFRMLWFTVRIGSFLGWKVPLAMVLYFVVAGAVVRLVMPDYTALYKRISTCSARFKFCHTRVKICAESIAFFAGDDREFEITNKRFEEVMQLEWARNWLTFKFRVIEDFFRARMPEMIRWVMVFSYAHFFGGTDAEMLADKGAKVNRGQTYLQTLCQQLFSCLGRLIGLAEPWANMTGMLSNISEVLEVMDELEQVGSVARPKGASTALIQASDDDVIELSHADIVTPGGSCVAQDLSMQLRPGHGIMVTGANAVGKTSLVRVLGGLWPLHSGRLVRKVSSTASSNAPSVRDLFFVPQKIHMVSGSLWDQITYPEKVGVLGSSKQAELQAVLDLVGVGYLVDRWKDDSSHVEDPAQVLAAVAHGTYCGCAVCKQAAGIGTRWEDILSLGEQQRIMMARMFYHSPTFGVLDECTSAVSVEAEQKLYAAAFARGISCITVSQRLGLQQFHETEFRFGANTPEGWTMHDIVK